MIIGLGVRDGRETNESGDGRSDLLAVQVLEVATDLEGLLHVGEQVGAVDGREVDESDGTVALVALEAAIHEHSQVARLHRLEELRWRE